MGIRSSEPTVKPKEVSLEDLVTAKFTELGIDWNLVEAACWIDEREGEGKQRLSFDYAEIKEAFRNIKDRYFGKGFFCVDTRVRFYLWHSGYVLFVSSNDELGNYKIEAIPRNPTSKVKPYIVDGLR